MYFRTGTCSPDVTPEEPLWHSSRKKDMGTQAWSTWDLWPY